MWIAARKMRLKLQDGLVGGVNKDGSSFLGLWVPAEVEVETKLCQMGMNEGQEGWDGCGLVYLKYFLGRSSVDF